MVSRKKQKKSKNREPELSVDKRGYVRIPTVAGFFSSIGAAQPTKEVGHTGLLLRVARTSPSSPKSLVITNRKRKVVAKVKLYTKDVMDLARAAYMALPEHSQRNLRKMLRK